MKKSLSIIAVATGLLTAACGGGSSEQSLMDYCIQEYQSARDRHPEMAPFELTTRQQCEAGVAEGLLTDKGSVDTLVRVVEDMLKALDY